MRLPRFRLRTLMLLVAIASVLCWYVVRARAGRFCPICFSTTDVFPIIDVYHDHNLVPDEYYDEATISYGGKDSAEMVADADAKRKQLIALGARVGWQRWRCQRCGMSW